MDYTLVLRFDGDYTQAVRPDVLARTLDELDVLERGASPGVWEAWAGEAQGRVRFRIGERGFPMDEETEDYVDSLLLTVSAEAAGLPEALTLAWTAARHVASRLRWEVFDPQAGRVLGSDDRIRFESGAITWGTSGGSDERRSAGPGASRIGG